MKAIVYTQYGTPDVLQLQEVEKPAPKDDEVLVEVHAASLNAGDWHCLIGKPFLIRLMGGLRKPKHNILGDDVSGRVEAVGRNVTQFQPGDEVFGLGNFGAFAEYSCVKEKYLALKPANVSFEDAATLPEAGITALQSIRDKGKIQSGQKVLINGASGGVGTLAIQIAKSFGAEVTGVCSTRKLEMVRSIGADHIVDYTQEDFTKNGLLYDLIFDIAAYHSFFDNKRSLTPKGIYVCVGGSQAKYFKAALLGPLISMFGSKKMSSNLGNPNQKDLAYLAELVGAGKVVPVIGSRYALSEVAEALRYFGAGHHQGKVVITVKHNNKT